MAEPIFTDDVDTLFSDWWHDPSSTAQILPAAARESWVKTGFQAGCDAIVLRTASLADDEFNDLLEACKAFTAHYPCGINPELDSAYCAALAAIAKVTREAK